MNLPSRETALALLKEFNSEDKHIRHGLAVEAAMRYLARKQGENENEWGIIGLIHDLDYGRFPEQHCQKTGEILAERGWPAEAIHAAVSHGWGICSAEEPLSNLEKHLFAIDELTGLVAASALVRPSRSVRDIEVKSVKKKWKDKGFAAGVNREVIEKGCQRLGVVLDDLIHDTIMGMREAADQIGL